MDFFGIGNAMLALIAAYSNLSRRTGRTSGLVASLKPGDRVVCVNAATELALLLCCRKAKIGFTPATLVLSVDEVYRLPEYGPSEGRTLFDHTWVEEYYRRGVERMVVDLDHLQVRAGAFRASPSLEFQVSREG